jgi:tetratricopeptide (TPR) repeat protein
LAVLHAQQGQYDKARTALEMAIRTNPSYATAYENLGDVYAKLASQAYSKALQIDTRSAVAPKLAMIRDLFPKERNMIAAAAPAPAPAPAAVAPAPAPAVTKPVPAPAPVAASEIKPNNGAAAEREVEEAVRAWASAWSRKDMGDYYAAYAKDFNGGKSRKAWEEERRQRIVGKRSISVKISDLDVTVNGDKAVARFRQDYKADSLDISGGKRLDLVRSNGNWVIVKESAGS